MERKTADEYPQELLDLLHWHQHGDMDLIYILSGSKMRQSSPARLNASDLLLLVGIFAPAAQYRKPAKNNKRN